MLSGSGGRADGRFRGIGGVLPCRHVPPGRRACGCVGVSGCRGVGVSPPAAAVAVAGARRAAPVRRPRALRRRRRCAERDAGAAAAPAAAIVRADEVG
ncbi:hypothetical protein C7S16_2760 [Burkholderia thailandensis]|uniref:Uncharacterized protein n=1 Tax=Burkholderia thailandensis TaxID=57975 RepID=A0AAW9CXI9_BURTH|nr:hypothetical protein [Burkholderia thailandensis]MDW9254601.1 hypothetical protein [Burkholderia thailandensis]